MAKTQRAVIIDEGWRSGSLSAEICTRIIEQAFWELDAPVGRVCSEEVPIPYATPPRTGGDPAGAPDHRGGESRAWASVRTRPWSSSACPPWEPTWRRAHWSNGW